MQLIACSPETPRFPPPYHEIDVYDLQEKAIQGILAEIEHQQATASMDKPVAEEQNIASEILRQHVNSAGLNRREIKELRAFLKLPMVGASVTRLRQAVNDYSASGNLIPLFETIRELAEHQAPTNQALSTERRHRRLTRDDLHLVCYEYIVA